MVIIRNVVIAINQFRPQTSSIPLINLQLQSQSVLPQPASTKPNLKLAKLILFVRMLVVVERTTRGAAWGAGR